MIIKIAELARQAGVSRQAAHAWVRRHDIPLDVDLNTGRVLGIDGSAQVAVDYIAAPRPRPLGYVPRSSAQVVQVVDRSERAVQEIRKITAAADRAELALAASLGEVLERQLVVEAFNTLKATLDEQFRAFDEREGAALYALARKPDANINAWSADLRDRIERSLMVSVHTAARACARFPKLTRR
jgi:hypothetical protein